MCDILIPEYIIQADKRIYLVNNVVIDLHGLHHFMRNCNRVKGGSVLKGKILENEGYVYQYIGVDEWQLAGEDKGTFLKTILAHIARKHGKEMDKKSIKASRKIESI